MGSTTIFLGVLCSFLLVTAVTTAILRDVVAVIVVFAAYSLGMALFYAALLAPDVAMTEAAIGAGVTTLLLLLTIARTTRNSADTGFVSPNPIALLAVGAFVLAIGTTLPSFPAVGSAEAPVWANPEVTQYYLAEAYKETGVKNVVTAVLAGYRGFDTFGEAIVVFAAGIATLVAFDLEVFTRE